ncbi:MAG: VPLPA-CTERM sorting domain-containing protein, partial [Pseudomonadota bacterium]
GFGGDGGTGGDGGQGGGGAGGTVKVFGSVVDASGSVINAQGGGLSPFRGELGRFVLGNNTSSDAPIGIAAVTQSFDGARGMNIFTQDLAETPFIPDLVDGAELFGLLDDVTAQDTFFSALQSGSPNNAIGAVLRVDIGPGPGYNDDYTGFDMLLMLALGDTAINAPTLGFDPHGGVYQQPLTIGGYTRDLVFGGAGDMVLPSLLGNTIFATLIPEVDGFVSASGADAFGNLLLFGDQQLANGEAFYLVSQVPLPASGVFLLSGLSGLGLFRRVRKKALNL